MGRRKARTRSSAGAFQWPTASFGAGGRTVPGRNTLPYESAVPDCAPSCSSTTGVDAGMSGVEMNKSEVPAMEESVVPANPRGRTNGKSHRPAPPIHWPPGEALSGANRPERLQERRQMASTIQGDGNLAGDPGQLIQTSKTKPDKIPTRSLSRGDTEECQSWQANPMPDKNSAQRNEGAIGSGDSSRPPAEDVVCAPRHVITRKAINDPDKLDPDELMELVGAICKAASGRIQSAEAAANFCLLVTQKEREPRFIDCLVGWCLEWYNRRDELIPRQLWNEDEGERREAKAAPSPYQWTAFVAFLAELLVALTGGGRDGTGPVPVSTDHLPARLISALLCNCCQIMARWPAKDIEDEATDCCVHQLPERRKKRLRRTYVGVLVFTAFVLVLRMHFHIMELSPIDSFVDVVALVAIFVVTSAATIWGQSSAVCTALVGQWLSTQIALMRENLELNVARRQSRGLGAPFTSEMLAGTRRDLSELRRILSAWNEVVQFGLLAQLASDALSTCFGLYILVVGSEHSSDMVTQAVLRASVAACTLIAATWSSDNVGKQVKKLKCSIDSFVESGLVCSRSRREFQTFLLSFSSNRFLFSAAGFFDIKLPLLSKVAGAIFVHTTILVQTIRLGRGCKRIDAGPSKRVL